MLLRNLPATIACLILPAFQTVVHAYSGHHEAVRACGVILRDMPEKLATSFCSSYAEITDKTSTCTSTKTRHVTVTSIASCSATATSSTPKPTSKSSASKSSSSKSSVSKGSSSKSPSSKTSSTESSSITSTSTPQPGSSSTVTTSTQHSGVLTTTTTEPTCNAICTVTAADAVISYITETAIITSTIQLPAYQAPKRQKRIPAAFCPEVGVPCLMAGMDSAVIIEGCLRFVKPRVAYTETKVVKRTKTTTTTAPCATNYD